MKWLTCKVEDITGFVFLDMRGEKSVVLKALSATLELVGDRIEEGFPPAKITLR